MEGSGEVQPARTGVRVEIGGSGRVNVATGVAVLDHLLGLLARRAGFDLTLEVAPGSADAELAAAGRAIGDALEAPLRAAGARGHGSGIAPADEALASVALEVAERPLLVSNVDFSRERVAGLENDVVSRFLGELAAGACLTLHVRLLEGQERQHVLEAIFKALGTALGEACRPVT
ncbi:MAG: imidazoleglycerol-phosphate dehydratase HisB [Gaiellaceae bacterium]